MESKKKLLVMLVLIFVILGLGIFLFKGSMTGMVVKSSESISYREIEISPEGVNDVWGSIVSDELIMLIRQESGVNHIRGFSSSLILYNLSNGEEQVLFESGKFDGLNDSSKKLVINNIPRISSDLTTVTIGVMESWPLEFMPLNTPYQARIDLINNDIFFDEKPQEGHQTSLTDSGDLKVNDFMSHRMPISDTLDFIIEHNYTANTQKVFIAKTNDSNKQFLTSMTPSKPYFIKNQTFLFENNNKIILKNIETGTELILYDASTGIHNNVKGIYGLTEDKNILMSSVEDNFFLYNPFAQLWSLVATSGLDYTLNAAVYNGQGEVIYDNGNKILLQKIDKETGDGRLFFYMKPSKLAVFATGNQIPLLGKPTAQESQTYELKVGNRGGNIAPDFSLTTIDGREMSLSKLKKSGKSTVIYAWATWCPSCAKEFPGINSEFSASKYPNVEFLAVNIDLTEDNEIIRQYKEKKELNNLDFAMATEQFLLDYKIRSTTTKFAISSKGVIIYTGSGVLSKDDWAKILNVANQN